MAKKGHFRPILGGGPVAIGGVTGSRKNLFFFCCFFVFLCVFVVRVLGPKPGGISLLGVLLLVGAELAHELPRTVPHLPPSKELKTNKIIKSDLWATKDVALGCVALRSTATSDNIIYWGVLGRSLRCI